MDPGFTVHPIALTDGWCWEWGRAGGFRLQSCAMSKCGGSCSYPLRVTGTSMGRACGHGSLANPALPWADGMKFRESSALLPTWSSVHPFPLGGGGQHVCLKAGGVGKSLKAAVAPNQTTWSLGDYPHAARGCWGDRTPVSTSRATAQGLSRDDSCPPQLMAGVLPTAHSPCASQGCSCPACPWGCPLRFWGTM